MFTFDVFVSAETTMHCKVQGWQKKQEILIFPRTAGNTGISREMLVITGKYWEIRLILNLQI